MTYLSHPLQEKQSYPKCFVEKDSYEQKKPNEPHSPTLLPRALQPKEKYFLKKIMQLNEPNSLKLI